MNWDRIQSLELQLAQLRVRIHRMDDINLAMGREIELLTQERDTARSLACRLWDQLEHEAAE